VGAVPGDDVHVVLAGAPRAPERAPAAHEREPRFAAVGGGEDAAERGPLRADGIDVVGTAAPDGVQVVLRAEVLRRPARAAIAGVEDGAVLPDGVDVARAAAPDAVQVLRRAARERLPAVAAIGRARDEALVADDEDVIGRRAPDAVQDRALGDLL